MKLKFAQRWTLAAAAIIFVLGVQGSHGAVIIDEHFDQNVPDNSPVGGAPGWHAYALHNNVVTDYTATTPNGNYPSLSHGPAGAGSGIGYLVMGSGNLVSNVLVWRDTSTNFLGKLISEVSFFTKNNAAASSERFVVRIGTQWFATAATFSDPGGNTLWTSNHWVFTATAGTWRSLMTNTLSLGPALPTALPAGPITGVGFLGAIQADSGKIRIDEVQVTGFGTNDPPVVATPVVLPGTNLYVGMAVTLNVTASGFPPLAYQWRRHGTNLVNAPGVGGVQSPMLVLSNTTLADAGTYDVIVSNAFGTNASPNVQLTVTVPTPATVDLSGFDAGGNISVTQPDSDTLEVAWNTRNGHAFRAQFNLLPGQVLMRNLASAPGPGGTYTTLAQNVDARYRVTLGSRFAKAGWPYIFFDRVDANTPVPVSHLTSLDPKTVRVLTESSNRTRLVFSKLTLGPYSGDLTCLVYDGSPFLQFQASMVVDQPWVAYIYDALFYADFVNVAYRDTGGTFQTVSAASLGQRSPGEGAKVLAKHRTIMGTVSGGSGTLAVMAPPHTSVYPIDFSDNYGFLQAGRTFIGTKMSDSADNRYRPWVDAPIGSTQRMDVFLVLGTNIPASTLTQVLAYTHGDVFKAIPGHYTMAEHFHPEFTANYRSGGNSITPFKQAMQAMGLRIVQPMEFHGPGHPFNNETDRLAELKDMYELCAAYSDDSFLFLPGEEYNNWFGGHWSYMFPRPIYFTGWPGQSGRPFKLTNAVVNGVTYPLVYQVGDADRMSQLLQEEGGIAWTSHPRIKGSRVYPDAFVNNAFYRDDSFQSGDWKVMPLDLSKDRLGFRSFQLMDDTSQWGYRKAMLGEVDTFALNPTHEMYAHMNVNYLQLPAFPSKTNWSSVVDCIRNGQFFTTTGELLIHSWSAATTGVTATVEWYFPPAFAEITWGDTNGVHRLKQTLKAGTEFQTNQIVIPADLSQANWVRFEVWDVARNGAFTQPHWFHAPARPAVIAGFVRDFTLINSDTDAPVAGYDPISEGAVLNKAVLPPNLTLRANVSPLVMDSVVLDLDGNSVTRTQWPFSLAPCASGPGIGDSPSYDYAPSSLTVGGHMITATPWRGSTPGKPLTLNFSVVNHPPPPTSFLMDGLLDSPGYQIAGGLYAAVNDTTLYVAAAATDAHDQFLLVTDSLTALGPAPAAKSGLVACDLSDSGWLTHNGATRGLAWSNAGDSALCPESVTTGMMEGELDLVEAFGSVPPVLYLALAKYTSGEGGVLVVGSQIPPGNADANLDPTEFLALPTDTIRDRTLNGVFDVLEPGSTFSASFATNPGWFIVRWPAVPGHTYQVHSSDDPTQSFTPLSPLLLAGPGSFSMSYTDLPPAAVSQRFYQVGRLTSAASLLSRFRLDGDTVDTGPAGLGSTPTALTYTTDSREGSHAAAFDGAASAVATSGPNPVRGSFSVAFRLKPTATAAGSPGNQWYNGAGLVDADTPGPTTDWGVAMTGDAVAFGIGGGSTGTNVTVTSSLVATSMWQHVTATWHAASRRITLYLNGQSNAATLSASSEERLAAASIVLGRSATAAQFFPGLLDDIQIYDQELTPRDVAFLFGFPGLTLH